MVFMLLITSVVSTVFDVSEKVEKFLSQNVPAIEILIYYANFIPNIINIISPIVVFIATLYFTSRLAANTEIVAILSSGVSYRRFLVPYLLVGLLLASSDYYLKNNIMPKAYQEVAEFEAKYVNLGYNFRKRNFHRQISDSVYFYLSNFDYNFNTANYVSLEFYNDADEMYKKINGNTCYYDTIKKEWLFRNFTIREVDGIKEKLTVGDSFWISLPIDREDFGQKLRAMPSLTTRDLNEFIEQEKLGGDNNLAFYYIEKYRRTAQPFALFILIIIAASIASRKLRGGTGIHLLIGILIAVSYELTMRFSTTLSTNNGLEPLVAVWIPNILYTIVALVLIFKAQK